MSKLTKEFLLWTFSIAIVGFGLCYVVNILTGAAIDGDSAIMTILYLLGGWSPTIASFICLKKNNEVKGFKDWLKHVFDFKHNIVSYLCVIFLDVLVVLPKCIIWGYGLRAPIYAVFTVIPFTLIAGGLEEAGWRYVLQPELEKKYNFTVSTLIVSVIWWLWHTPIFLIPGLANYGQSFIGFGIIVFGLSFALAAIRRNTQSVWLCVLFHTLVNTLGNIIDVDFYGIPGNIVTAAILIVVSLILVKIGEKKKIFR